MLVGDGAALEVEASSCVETSTLKLSMTRSALPVNGSVPVCIAWMYWLFATPCLLTKYSAMGREDRKAETDRDRISSMIEFRRGEQVIVRR